MNNRQQLEQDVRDLVRTIQGHGGDQVRTPKVLYHVYRYDETCQLGKPYIYVVAKLIGVEENPFYQRVKITAGEKSGYLQKTGYGPSLWVPTTSPVTITYDEERMDLSGIKGTNPFATETPLSEYEVRLLRAIDYLTLERQRLPDPIPVDLLIDMAAIAGVDSSKVHQALRKLTENGYLKTDKDPRFPLSSDNSSGEYRPTQFLLDRYLF